MSMVLWTVKQLQGTLAMTTAHAGGKRIESLATTAVRDANAAHL